MAQNEDVTSFLRRAENAPRISFASRLSARAITGGIFTIYALFILFMTLCGAAGLWNFEVNRLSNLSAGFWFSTFACWIASVFLGAYVAAIGSRSATRRDGVVNGFVTWAVACTLACAFGVLAMALPSAPQSQSISRGLFLWLFVGDSLAVLASLLGGVWGARSEARVLPSPLPLKEIGTKDIHRAAG